MTSDETPPKGEVQKLRDANATKPSNLDGDEVCSFCGKGPKDINALVSKGSVRICDLCVNAARAGMQD